MIFNIDTLYLSAIRTVSDYNNFVITNSDIFINPTIRHIGTSHGYFWYKFDSYRLGVASDVASTLKANNFFIQIQFENDFLLGKQFDDIFSNLPFGITNYEINRIDLNYVCDINENKDFDLLQKLVITPFFRRSNTIGNTNGIIETRYLGTRNNGIVLRIYNKSKELRDVSSEKLFFFEKFFKKTDKLITFELEIHRKYLKSKNSSTLFDKDNFLFLYSFFVSILKSMRFYENNEKNKKNIQNENYNSVNFLKPFDFLDSNYLAFASSTPLYQPSIANLIHKINILISLYGVNFETLKQYFEDD